MAPALRGPREASVPRRFFTTADAVGGVWTYVLDLARGLAPHGVRTVVAVLGPEPSPAQRAAAREVPGLELVPTGLPLDWVTNDPDDVERAGVELARLARVHRAELVQVNSAPLAATGAFEAPLVVACHSCVATWWQAVHGDAPPPGYIAWRTAFAASAFARADVLVAPSAAFAEATATTYGLATPPTVVRNGRMIMLGPIARGGLPRQVFTAGRLWDEAKNVATLDRAALHVDAPITAAGPLTGPLGDTASFTHLACPGSLGPTEIATRLAQRPVFVSLARYEPFGLSVLEAAQAGCALVLADIPTFRELWDDAALFVPPDDERAVADVLNGLLGCDALRAALGTRARTRARRFTVSAMVGATLRAWGMARLETAA